MAIVNGHIETHEPYHGLGPSVLNVPTQWVGNVKASASNAVYTTANHFTATNNTINVSMAAGTQPDYPRNIVVKFAPNTGSAGLYSAGTLLLYGKDLYGSTRSESFAITAMGTASAPDRGSVNFQMLDSISVSGLQFHTNSSSARSAVSFYAGVGQKIGLPVKVFSTDAVFAIVQGTLQQSTYSGATSTNNQWTAVTGDYWQGGFSMSNVHNSASLLQVGFKLCGRAAGPEYRP